MEILNKFFDLFDLMYANNSKNAEVIVYGFQGSNKSLKVYKTTGGNLVVKYNGETAFIVPFHLYIDNRNKVIEATKSWIEQD